MKLCIRNLAGIFFTYKDMKLKVIIYLTNKLIMFYKSIVAWKSRY